MIKIYAYREHGKNFIKEEKTVTNIITDIHEQSKII
jgi:hypothetical protein